MRSHADILSAYSAAKAQLAQKLEAENARLEAARLKADAQYARAAAELEAVHTANLESRASVFARRAHDELRKLCAEHVSDPSRPTVIKIAAAFRQLDQESLHIVGQPLDDKMIGFVFASLQIEADPNCRAVFANPETWHASPGALEWCMRAARALRNPKGVSEAEIALKDLEARIGVMADPSRHYTRVAAEHAPALWDAIAFSGLKEVRDREVRRVADAQAAERQQLIDDTNADVQRALNGQDVPGRDSAWIAAVKDRLGTVKTGVGRLFG